MQPKRKQGSFQSIRLCSVMGCACSKEGVSRASSKPSKTSLSQGGGGPPSRQVSTLSERQQSTRYSGRLELTGKSGAAVAAVAVAAEKDYAQQRQRSHRHSGVLTSAPIPDPSSVARRPNRHGGVVGGDKTVVVAPVPAPTPSSFPSQNEAALVAAGWPTWLACVAGEAIKGWVPRRADSFEKLNKIGQGTYSNVYKARDIDSGKIVALKKVRFDNLEPESVRFMAREILILRRLRHPNIIGLEGLVTSRMSNSLYLVFEYMEHDLAGLAACPGIVFTEPQVKCYMQQLLSGLEHCHTSGVLHRDIKGSNLLLGNDGILKIADFGLATFYHPNQKQLLTSRVVTLWYRPPELLLGATDYGAAVDLWSTGCILAELLAGKPIMPGRTEVEQLHKIFKLCGSPSDDYWKKSKLPHATIFKPTQPYERCLAETFKDIPISALSLLDKLLAIEPLDRGTASSALRSEFFTTKPLACDPASLPHYPPSKEMDAKLRDAEARRQREAAKRATAKDHPSKAVPAPEPNSEVPVSHQKRPLLSHSGTKSKSEKFQPLEEDTAVGFPMEPPRQQNQQHQQHQHQHQHQGLPPRRAPVPVVPSVHHSLPTSVSGPISSASASSRSGPMGNPIASGAARRKKQSGGEDVRMAPQRVPPRSTKSFTVSEYATGSGDLTHLSSLAPTKGLSGSSELHQSIFKKTLESGRRVDMGNIRRDTDSSKDSSTTSSSSSRREGRAATRLIN